MGHDVQRRYGYPRLVATGGVGSRSGIAAVYDQAGADYLAYADGNPADLFSFDGPHAHADRCLWSVIEAKLRALRDTGADSVSILDAGCGPGTWLRRAVSHALTLGFSRITARGFDIAAAQVRTACRLTQEFACHPGVAMAFDVADLTDRLQEPDASVDLSLCLYSVLSHLPLIHLPVAAAELARVTKGHFITTVRAIGSTPTIFVDSLEKARQVRLDHRVDRCEVELHSGRKLALAFHLFSAGELRQRLEPYFRIEDLRGLDIFHGRFALDDQWNPASLLHDAGFTRELARLEESCARDKAFIDRANHLLLVGCPHALR